MKENLNEEEETKENKKKGLAKEEANFVFNEIYKQELTQVNIIPEEIKPVFKADITKSFFDNLLVL